MVRHADDQRHELLGTKSGVVYLTDFRKDMRASQRTIRVRMQGLAAPWSKMLLFLVPAGTKISGEENTIVYMPPKWYKTKRNLGNI